MQIAKGVINFPSQNPNTRRFILFHTKDRVSTELTSALRGLNIQFRGKSYAAPSDIPKPEKRGKRVSKDERRHMVEAFVNKYREANAGKFPSANDARNQVGGNYYVVKLILQELVYNSKISPSEDIVKKTLIKESVKRNESLVEIAEVSTSPMTANEEVESKLPLVSSLEIEKNHSEVKESAKRNEFVIEIAEVGTSTMTANEKLESEVLLSLEIEDSHSEAKEELQTNILVEDTLSEDTVKSQTTATLLDTTPTEGHLQTGTTVEVSHQILETAEGGRKEEVSTKIVQDFANPKHDPLHNQESSEDDNLAADTSTEKIKDEELRIKPTLWGNLKSLAEDLLNIWKKR